MNKNLKNYRYKAGLLFAATLSINFTNKIVYCSLLFTFLIFILNCIGHYHGIKKATLSILFSTATTFGLLYHKQYCIIAGKPIVGLISVSLCATLIASYIGVKIFIKLAPRYGFAVSNCISLCISSLVDHFIMGLFFTTIFPIHKIWLMFYKETAYSLLFGFLVFLYSVALLYSKRVYFKIRKYFYAHLTVTNRTKSKTSIL